MENIENLEAIEQIENVEKPKKDKKPKKERNTKKTEKPVKVKAEKPKKEKKPIDIALTKKRLSAQASIALSTTTAITIGAVPIPFPDSNILVTVETDLVRDVLKSYDIQISQELINAVVSSAAITAVAKRALNALKVIPNIGASVINAVVAGFFVAALGEAVCALSEAIIVGKIDPKKLDLITEYVTNKLSENPILGYMIKYFLENSAKLKNMNAKQIYKIIFKAIRSAKKAEKKK